MLELLGCLLCDDAGANPRTRLPCEFTRLGGIPSHEFWHSFALGAPRALSRRSCSPESYACGDLRYNIDTFLQIEA